MTELVRHDGRVQAFRSEDERLVLRNGCPLNLRLARPPDHVSQHVIELVFLTNSVVEMLVHYGVVSLTGYVRTGTESAAFYSMRTSHRGLEALHEFPAWVLDALSVHGIDGQRRVGGT